MRKVFVVAAILALTPVFTFAQFTAEDSGLIDTGTNVYGGLTGDQADLGTFIGARIINPLFILSGLIFLVLIIYAGLTWMTSSGNEARVQKAKDILTSSVIGIVIMVMAYAFVRFILIAVSGG